MTPDSVDATQPSPIGLGNFGTTREDAIQLARKFLSQRGVPEEVFLVFNGGRAQGKGVPFPGNLWPKVVIASSGWWILDRKGRRSLAEGDLSEISWTKTTSDGFKILLNDEREVRFFTGALNSEHMSSAVLAAVANARLHAARFDNEVPAQRPLLLAGAHYGGYGTALPPDTSVVMALSGRGLCVMSPSSTFQRPLADLRSVQVGGIGEYTTGGGWVGGGFGIEGALEGAAFATVMNWLTTRKRMDSILRLSFDDAEATFGFETHAPGRIEIEMSALLASMRGRDAAPGSGALGLATLATRNPVPNVTSASARFCGQCGTSRPQGHAFCGSCGAKY